MEVEAEDPGALCRRLVEKHEKHGGAKKNRKGRRSKGRRPHVQGCEKEDSTTRWW
jgi:hypothetical protein